MPRPVVPIFWLFSLAPSSSLWYGSTRCARSLTKSGRRRRCRAWRARRARRRRSRDPARRRCRRAAHAADAGSRRDLVQDERACRRCRPCGRRWRRPGSARPSRPARPARRRACPCPRRPTGRRRPPRRWSWRRTCRIPAWPNKKSPSRGSSILGQTYAPSSQQSIRRERPPHPLRGLEREPSRACRAACGSCGACAR